jgi:hypothetical protein
MQRSLFLNRRVFSLAIAALPFALAALPSAARAAGGRLRIGYQKNGALLILMQKGTLESRLAERGVAVSWHEFPSGSPLLEALNADGIDFGARPGSHLHRLPRQDGEVAVSVSKDCSQSCAPLRAVRLRRADGPVQACGSPATKGADRTGSAIFSGTRSIGRRSRCDVPVQASPIRREAQTIRIG